MITYIDYNENLAKELEVFLSLTDGVVQGSLLALSLKLKAYLIFYKNGIGDSASKNNHVDQ